MDLLSIKRRALGHCACDNWAGSSSNEGGSSTSTSGAGEGSTGGGASTSLGGISPGSALSALPAASSTVADAIVTSPAGQVQGVGTGAPAEAGGTAPSSGIASAVGAGQSEFKQAIDGIKTVGGWFMQALGFAANPVFTIGKIAVQNSDNWGKPNPYGATQAIGSSGGAMGSGYVSALPAPNSMQAMRTSTAAAAMPAISTSYITTRSNAQASQQQPQGGALAALALVATLILSS